MVRNAIFLLLVFLSGFTSASTTSIFDFLWTEPAVESRDDSTDSENQKTCECLQASCKCCVDFNMTYIDLGGPGCVQLQYISQAEGISVNVSYGENLLHSQQVKGPNPSPTCLGSLAQVCARVSSLEPHNDGLKGCVLLESKFLGDMQTRFDIGCFLMGPEGMKLDPDSNSTLNQFIEDEADNGNSTETGTEAEGFNEEELIAVVNESAEKGLLFFENLLGMAFGELDVNDTEVSSQIETSATSAESSRKIRKLSSKINLL